MIIGLYDDQECDDIIIERKPWESVKSGPSGEIAISSRYAIFYRKGSLDEIDANDSFGVKDSVEAIYPPCHWIFNIPEGIKSVYSIYKMISNIKNFQRQCEY